MCRIVFLYTVCIYVDIQSHMQSSLPHWLLSTSPPCDEDGGLTEQLTLPPLVARIHTKGIIPKFKKVVDLMQRLDTLRDGGSERAAGSTVLFDNGVVQECIAYTQKDISNAQEDLLKCWDNSLYHQNHYTEDSAGRTSLQHQYRDLCTDIISDVTTTTATTMNISFEKLQLYLILLSEVVSPI